MKARTIKSLKIILGNNYDFREKKDFLRHKKALSIKEKINPDLIKLRLSIFQKIP